MRAGTMTRPPPTPKSPERNPAPTPVAMTRRTRLTVMRWESVSGMPSL